MTEHPERILGFDFLRGICALAVAIYHLGSWFGLYQLYNCGLYAVYIFFVLSGASLYLSYCHKLEPTFTHYGRFLALRLFRIAPLFWLALAATCFAMTSLPPVGTIALNASFLFGFSAGDDSLVTGGWSLAIECIFYFLFPVFLWLCRTWRRALLFTLSALAIQFAYISQVIISRGDLSAFWSLYVQFFSFIGYFAAGCVIGKFYKERYNLMPALFTWGLFTLVLASVLFTHSTFAEDSLTGTRGLLLMLGSCFLVWLSGALRFNALGNKLALAFGRMSYGLYLLHPLFPLYLPPLGLPPHALLILMLAGSVVGALIIERWFERPIRNFGHQRLKLSTHSAPHAAQSA
jgi:peptidoglycan/LPS O-acetylase OafA/YrhL